jgi:hypothetical protein
MSISVGIERVGVDHNQYKATIMSIDEIKAQTDSLIDLLDRCKPILTTQKVLQALRSDKVVNYPLYHEYAILEMKKQVSAIFANIRAKYAHNGLGFKIETINKIESSVKYRIMCIMKDAYKIQNQK